jgi:hypothetical protein
MGAEEMLDSETPTVKTGLKRSRTCIYKGMTMFGISVIGSLISGIRYL